VTRLWIAYSQISEKTESARFSLGLALSDVVNACFQGFAKRGGEIDLLESLGDMQGPAIRGSPDVAARGRCDGAAGYLSWTGGYKAERCIRGELWQDGGRV